MQRDFLDTNILVYAFSTDPRGRKAEVLMADGYAIGVQTLNEFTNVARRKLGMNWQETSQALGVVRKLAVAIVPLDLQTHERALSIARRHNLSTFDATMLAAALQAGCTIFWSEDLQDGMIIDQSLRIENPFA